MNSPMILSILIVLTQSSISTVDGSPRGRHEGQSSRLGEPSLSRPPEPNWELQDPPQEWVNLFTKLQKETPDAKEVIGALGLMSTLEKMPAFNMAYDSINPNLLPYLPKIRNWIITESTDALLQVFHLGDSDCSGESLTHHLNMSKMYRDFKSIQEGLLANLYQRQDKCWNKWMRELNEHIKEMSHESLDRLDTIAREIKFRPDGKPFQLFTPQSPELVVVESNGYVEELVNYLEAAKSEPLIPENTDLFNYVIKEPCKELVQQHHLRIDALDNFLAIFTRREPFMDDAHLEMIDRLRMCRVIQKGIKTLRTNVMNQLTQPN